MGIISGARCPVTVARSAGLVSQRLDRQAVHMLDELPRHRFELFHQGPSLFELATRRLIFEVRRHGTDHGGKRRHRPTKLVSRLA